MAQSLVHKLPQTRLSITLFSFQMMKNKIIPLIHRNFVLEYLQSKSKMQLSNEHTLKPFRKLKSRTLAMTSIILTSLIIMFCIIPTFWIIFILMTDDEKILSKFQNIEIFLFDTQPGSAWLGVKMPKKWTFDWVIAPPKYGCEVVE